MKVLVISSGGRKHAVAWKLDSGLRTRDIVQRGASGAAETIVGTKEMGDAVVKLLEQQEKI